MAKKRRRKVFNKTWVLGNLRETAEHIESAVKLIEETGRGESVLEAWIEFIYRDLNRAWNGRNMTIAECQANDEQIRSFPPDIEFGD